MAGELVQSAAEALRGAVRVAAHRLRQRFREHLLTAVRDTLAPAKPDDDEDNRELIERLAALQP